MPISPSSPSKLTMPAAELITSGFSLTARNERWVAARGQHDRSRVLTEYRATADRLAVPTAELPRPRHRDEHSLGSHHAVSTSTDSFVFWVFDLIGVVAEL